MDLHGRNARHVVLRSAIYPGFPPFTNPGLTVEPWPVTGHPRMLLQSHGLLIRMVVLRQFFVESIGPPEDYSFVIRGQMLLPDADPSAEVNVRFDVKFTPPPNANAINGNSLALMFPSFQQIKERVDGVQLPWPQVLLP